MTKMKCDNCGNSYDKTFMVVQSGQTHVFDCFECAIQMLAPQCQHCGTRVIGHGVEQDGRIYCCAHCAKHEGDLDLRDRVEHRP